MVYQGPVVARSVHDPGSTLDRHTPLLCRGGRGGVVSVVRTGYSGASRSSCMQIAAAGGGLRRRLVGERGASRRGGAGGVTADVLPAPAATEEI
jgi:hypothetical protein